MGRSISFGVILIPFQTLDAVGPLDILSNITKPFVSAYANVIPDKIAQASVDKAPEIQFHHIGPTMDPVLLTANFHCQPTCTVDNCPKLDYLLVGGTEPSYAMNMPEPIRRFLVERSQQVKTVFTTCTGGLILAATGVLDGLKVTTNHAFIGFGGKIAPKVHWEKDPLWVVDRNAASGVEFWTAAGAVAGMDMMAEWVKREFGEDLLNVSTMALEFGPRDVNAKPVSVMNGKGEMIEVH